MIFDTHAHYDDEAFDADREELLAALPAMGVGRVVNVGASLSGARESMAFAGRWTYICGAVGIHPDHAAQLTDDVLQELAGMAASEKCVAIGEIGLDYHWNVEPREVQQAAFIRQMRLAAELDLPINVHSRDAAQDTFDLIRSEHAGTTGGIIHCYSGSAEMAMEYVKLGYHIGVGGVVTFKNARVLREVVQKVPLGALVTETDSPYLSPEPYRGKRNDSSRIRYIIDEIARERGMDREETEAILYENALRVYRLAE